MNTLGGFCDVSLRVIGGVAIVAAGFGLLYWWAL
jgi:uncharacterized protein YjeT (DUF2065 family)